MRITFPLVSVAALTAGAISPALAQVDGLSCWNEAILGVSERINSPLRSVDTDGNLGVTTTSNWLYLFDMSPEGVPELITYVEGSSGVQRAKISGDLVAAIAGTDTVRLYDVSDPATPVFASQITGPSLGDLADTSSYFGTASDPFELEGSLLYTVADSGITIYDVSDPASPSLVGSVNHAMTAFTVRLSGGIAYVADQVDGVHMFDVSVPSSPAYLGSTSGLPAADLAVSGDTVYLMPGINEHIGAYSDVMIVVDCADPSVPSLVGTVPVPHAAISAAVDDDMLYVTTRLGLDVFDIANPASPVLLRHAASLDYSGWHSRVAIADAGVVVSGYSKLLSFERGNRTQGNGWVANLYSGSPSIRSVIGSMLYAWDQANSELTATDLSDPTSPVVLGTLSLPGSPDNVGSIIAGDGVIYLRAEDNEFWAIDVSDPAAMSAAGNWQFEVFQLLEVVSQGGYLFGANWFGGMMVLDVSDPNAAGTSVMFPFSQTGAEYYHIAVRGDVAFLGGHAQSPGRDHYYFVAADISDPLQPVYLDGQVFGDHSIQDIAFIDDETVVVLGGPHADDYEANAIALVTLDVSDPANITRISSLELGTSFFESNSLLAQLSSTTEVEVAGRSVFVPISFADKSKPGPNATGLLLAEVLPDGSLAPLMSFPFLSTSRGANTFAPNDQRLHPPKNDQYVFLRNSNVFRVGCGPVPCPADLAEPSGVLNFFDVSAYISLYNAGDAQADFAEPFGTLNFFDISAFLSAYNAGCP